MFLNVKMSPLKPFTEIENVTFKKFFPISPVIVLPGELNLWTENTSTVYINLIRQWGRFH